MSSEYFEPVKKMIQSKLAITNHFCESEYYIYDEKKDAALSITPSRVVYKGYTVPLNESEVEDLYSMVSLTYNLQENKNKEKALKELKEKK